MFGSSGLSGPRAGTMARCLCALALLALTPIAWGHVALTFPPARKFDLDFLDTFRTKPPCGMPKGESEELTFSWRCL